MTIPARRGLCLVLASPSGGGKTAIARRLVASESNLSLSVSIAPVDAALPQGQDMVFDIDWQGHRSLRAGMPGDVVGVFIMPPSLHALEERLHKRGDGAAAVASRMARARDEISHWAEFDHVVVNEDFERAVAEVRAILHAARLVTSRQQGLADFVARLDDVPRA